MLVLSWLGHLGQVTVQHSVSVESHNVFYVWMWFYLGMLAYMYKRAFIAVRNERYKTKHQFFWLNRDVLGARALFESALFWIWVSYPSIVPAILKRASSFLPSWIGPLDFELPPSPAVAFFVGMVIDVGVDLLQVRVPFLKNELPNADVAKKLADVAKKMEQEEEKVLSDEKKK